jgi:LysR family transcriptional regulator, hca operon transcriptional activator
MVSRMDFENRLPRRQAEAAWSPTSVLTGETFLSISGTAMSASGRPPALRLAIDRYIKKSGINIKTSHTVDNLGGIMSLISSTGGVALLPAYARTFLPREVTTRLLRGFTPKSVNILVRAQYVPFFSRLGLYEPALLDALTAAKPKRFFEY